MSRWIWITIGGVAIAALAFFGGVFVGRATGSSFGGANGFRQGFGANGARPGGAVSGDVLKVDASGMTVKTSDGSTKNVVFSSTTTVIKSESLKVSDIKVGDKVGTFGQADTAGTVTARIVSIGGVNPFGGFGRFGAGGGQNGANGQNRSGGNTNGGGGGGFGGPPPGAP